MRTIHTLILGLAFFASNATAEPVVIIVNEANSQSLSAADVKNIYSDQKINWAGGDRLIKVYELSVRAPLREDFSQKILGMSAQESARFWANKKITNTAKNLPRAKRESSIVSAVSRDPDAIGYVSQKAATGKSGIRVVLTVE